jgi:hypothetical protein
MRAWPRRPRRTAIGSLSAQQRTACGRESWAQRGVHWQVAQLMPGAAATGGTAGGGGVQQNTNADMNK